MKAGHTGVPGAGKAPGGIGPHRPRRLRRSGLIRSMVRETSLRTEDLVMPFFVCPGEGVQREILSMPGNHQLSTDLLVEECRLVSGLGIPAVLLFGIPEEKDAVGTSGYDPAGIVPAAVRAIKEAGLDLLVIADVCPLRVHRSRALRHPR